MKFQDFKNTPLYGVLPNVKEIFIECAYNLHDFDVIVDGDRVILKTNSNFAEVNDGK